MGRPQGPPENPFYRYLPQTRPIGAPLPRGGGGRLFSLYRTGQLAGAILDHPDAPWPVRRAARWELDALRAARDYPLVWEESPEHARLHGAGRGRRVLQWHDYLRIDPRKAMRGRQLTGDCVSWAIRDALDRLRCSRIGAGAWEAYLQRQATCGIYAGRGHTGQGAEPGRLSDWAVRMGTLLEQTYLGGKYDFRDYDQYVSWGMEHGASGVPEELLELTRPYTAQRAYLVQTSEGLRDALAGGCTAHCGSMLGVADWGDPVSPRSGSWSHDMSVCGFDFTRELIDQDVWIWDQSWGPWNRVTNLPDAWLPWGEGMFATDDAAMRYAIGCNGTWVFVAGKWFEAEKVDDLVI